MNLRIRDRLVVLIIAPLTVLGVFIATVTWLQIETQATTDRLIYWNRSLAAYETLLNTLEDAETGMRGYVIAGVPRFKRPYEHAATQLEPELDKLAKLAGSRAGAGPVRSLVALARSAFAADAAIVADVDRGRRTTAERAVASGEQMQAMDRFRAAVSKLEDDASSRRAGYTSVREALWNRLDALLGVAAFVGLGVTVALYIMMSRSIADRLRRVGEDALAISRGLVPASDLSGNDEITQLGRSLRTIIAVGRSREDDLRKYKLLADQAQHALFWVDPDDRIVEANQAAADTYGYSRAELFEMRAGQLRAPETQRSVSEELLHARAEGTAFFETTHVRKDGERFAAEVSLNTTIIDDVQMVLGIVRDISERKRIEAATEAFHAATEASLRLKSEFVTTMSHEIRTPMNAVIGMTELLVDSDLTLEQRRHAEIIRDASFSLLGIIDNILDFSKMEAGHMELERRETNVLDLVESAAAVSAGQAHRKGISLMTHVDARVPMTVLSDQLRIRQILINLIGNAVKFTETGSVVVSVTREGEAAASSLVRFAVADSGIGFDARTASKIFEPFQQADGSTTRKYGGTGLGLSICRQLVDLLGGELVAESTPGVGSEFAFTLTLEHGPVSHEPGLRPIAGKRALIVDNDESARRILCRSLERWEIACDAVEDATAALDALHRNARAGTPYDLAVIDYAMPSCDGLELGRRIKADERIAKTALMMVTAFDASKRGQTAIAAGFLHYLTKPVRQSHLHDCIVDAVSPLPVVPPAVRVETTYERTPCAVPSRSERILLVEDEPVNQLLAKRQLEKLGFAAHGVANGAQAVAATSHDDYDLVLMDCQMPVMDGLAATRAIRFRESATGRRVPIIAMTANARHEDRDECFAAGMDDYLAKPVLIEQLKTTLATWLAEATLVFR